MSVHCDKCKGIIEIDKDPGKSRQINNFLFMELDLCKHCSINLMAKLQKMRNQFYLKEVLTEKK